MIVNLFKIGFIFLCQKTLGVEYIFSMMSANFKFVARINGIPFPPSIGSLNLTCKTLVDFASVKTFCSPVEIVLNSASTSSFVQIPALKTSALKNELAEFSD